MDITGLVTGLSSSLNNYLGLQQQVQYENRKNERAYAQQKELQGMQQAYDTQKQTRQAELDKQQTVFKMSLEDAAKRGQSVMLAQLKDDPEFSILAESAPEALIDAKDVIGYKMAKLKAATEKKPSESQYKAGNFFKRASQSVADLESLIDEGVDPTGLMFNANAFKHSAIQSADWKRYMQTRDNFINAYLRRDSGAAISKEEYSTADRQFFPMPNDDEKTLAQKAANRAGIIASFKNEAEGTSIDLTVPKTSDYIDKTSKAIAGPKIGTVDGGYKFRGGNPADPKSWVKI